MPHYTWVVGDQHHPRDYEYVYVVFGNHQVLAAIDKDDNDGIKDINSSSTKDTKERKKLSKVWNSANVSRYKYKTRYHVANDELKFGAESKFTHIRKHGNEYRFQEVDSNGKHYSLYLKKKYKKIKPIHF